MTDTRLDGKIRQAIAALPPRSAVIVRHDHLPPLARHRLFLAIRRQARARDISVFLAGKSAQAKRWGADGVHLRGRIIGGAAAARRHGLIVSTPVHDRRQAHRARRAGADAALISPVFATASHPRAVGIGPRGFTALSLRTGRAAPVGLGGMTAARFRRLRRHGAAGWAAVGAWG